MTSRSNPDWLKALIAEEGETRLVSAGEKTSLVDALTAAESPEPLDPDRHARLLAAALGTLERDRGESVEALVAGEQERDAASQLGESLELDDIATLLRAAHDPSAISARVEQRIRFAALSAPNERRPRVASATLWGTLAAAAAVALWVTSSLQTKMSNIESHRSSALNYAQSRSTDALFTEAFAQSTPSERIDRIALARQRELRENRYRKWGVP
jgi:hypothetical protein